MIIISLSLLGIGSEAITRVICHFLWSCAADWATLEENHWLGWFIEDFDGQANWNEFSSEGDCSIALYFVYLPSVLPLLNHSLPIANKSTHDKVYNGGKPQQKPFFIIVRTEKRRPPLVYIISGGIWLNAQLQEVPLT